MKKYLLFVLSFLFGIITLFSQNITRVDATVKLYDDHFATPGDLAEQIEMDFHTDKQKVRAIYAWMVTHIRYDITEKGRLEIAYSSIKDKNKRQRKLKKRLAKRVISSKKAVHGGYALLFEEMCNLLHIRSKVVVGMGKSKTNDIGKKVRTNHTWNIVEIEDQYYLIDTAWGAGQFSTKNGFISDTNYFYFLTDPALFINDHYPKDYKNSLLDYLVPKDIFSKAPLMYKDNSIAFDLIFPTDGYVIRNSNNHFVIKTKKKVTEVFYMMKRKKVMVSHFNQTEDEISFDIDLNRIRIRNLVLYIDDAPVFGFKLKHANR